MKRCEISEQGPVVRGHCRDLEETPDTAEPWQTHCRGFGFLMKV